MTSGHFLLRWVRTENARAGLLQTSSFTVLPVVSCNMASPCPLPSMHASSTLHNYKFKLDKACISQKRKTYRNSALQHPVANIITDCWEFDMCSSLPIVQQKHDEFCQLWKVLELPVETDRTDHMVHADTEEVQDAIQIFINCYQFFSLTIIRIFVLKHVRTRTTAQLPKHIIY